MSYFEPSEYYYNPGDPAYGPGFDEPVPGWGFRPNMVGPRRIGVSGLSGVNCGSGVEIPCAPGVCAPNKAAADAACVGVAKAAAAEKANPEQAEVDKVIGSIKMARIAVQDVNKNYYAGNCAQADASANTAIQNVQYVLRSKSLRPEVVSLGPEAIKIFTTMSAFRTRLKKEMSSANSVYLSACKKPSTQAVAPAAESADEKPAQSDSTTWILVGVAALAAGGVGYYVWKKRHSG